MDGNTIRDKLRARRRAMNLTAQSDANVTSASVIEDSTTYMEGDGEEETEHDGKNLVSMLESRREASKRKLKNAELEEETDVFSPDQSLGEQSFTEDILSSPRTSIPTPSLGPASPRSESRSSTPHGGRSGQHSLLKNRFQARLNKRSGTPSGRRIQDRITLSTRFDRTTKEYNELEESQLLQKINSKLKWKDVVAKTKVTRGEPTAEEAFDFFTKQFEDEKPPDNPPPVLLKTPVPPPEQTPLPAEQVSPDAVADTGDTGDSPQGVSEEPGTSSPREDVAGPSSSPDVVQEEDATSPPDGTGDQPEQQTETATEDAKKSIQEVVPKELDWRLYYLIAATYEDHDVTVERELLNYFVPSMMPADIHQKVEENVMPRYLEDEGFYVGEKPEVLPQNRNILENRLLRQPDKGEGWFGANGEVKTIPNPVKQYPTKPWDHALEDVDQSVETIYIKATMSATEDKYLQSSDENELQIDISAVTFLHHHLMSREHVLASNISQIYDEYLQRRHKNYVNFYTDKLYALRNAVHTLKEVFHQSINSENGNTAQEMRINDYMAEIRRTSNQLDEAESTERDLMRRIIEEWKEVKSLREAQGFNNTSIKLTIKREEVNQQSDKERWEVEVDTEVEERFCEYDMTVTRDYREAQNKYENQLREWKKNRLKMKQRRKKVNQGSKENLLDTATDVEEEEITIAGNIDKPQKPTKPEVFDREIVKTQVMTNLLEKRRNPGESKISLELTHTTNITSTLSVPAGEANRRKAMQKSSVLLKILFNGKEVFRTEPKTLTSDFKLHFGSIFRVRIAQWPESLKVQFFDVGLVINTMMSEIYLRIPEVAVHSGNVQLGVIGFSSEQAHTYEHEGVGSNAPFMLRQKDTNPSSFVTKGQLVSSVSWGLDERGHVLAPKGLFDRDSDPYSGLNPLKSVDPVVAIGADGIQDPESLSKWVKNSRLDPNDPENASLIPFMNSEDGHGFVYAPDYFQLEQLQEEFNFLTDEDFSRLNRFRLLELRSKEVQEFRNMAMIPAQELEIMDSAFTSYERRLREKDSLQVGEGKIAGGSLSLHRLEVLRFRQRVKEAVLHRFYTSRHNFTLQDMVHEEQVPDIGTLGASIAKLAEPRRPLKASRKIRKKATAQNLSEGSVSILVNVVRGYNVPIRQAQHSALDNRGGRRLATVNSNIGVGLPQTNIDVHHYLVSPYVSVSFQGTVISSSVAQGPSPSWNEELHVPFLAPNNDYSATNLQTVDDVLFINLFDRIVEQDGPKYGDEDGSVVTHRIQNYWLGSFKLPFSTIYQRGKIEGTFRIKVPPNLLGYTFEKEITTHHQLADQIEEQLLNSSSGTYLTLFVTLEPILKPLDPPKHKFESAEDERVLSLSDMFLTECNKKFPSRNVKATVIDIKGESVLLTRYVHPIQPPLELIEGSDPLSLATAERIARFVSFIPFVSDNVAYAGICDLWSTCDQFVQMLCGDEEEHAILLLNYFLYLGKKAYLVLGDAVPEGSTAYVMTVETATREYLIWNASTGQHYSHLDNLSPLQSIGTLVDESNIWFNVQPQELPSRVKMEVDRAIYWKPLFTSKNPKPELQTVQPDTLHYAVTDPYYVSKLTDTIEQTLKDKIFSWRPRHITRWDRSCNIILHDILKGMEPTRNTQTQPQHVQQLLDRLGDVKFTGFPMDLPFTDIDSIVSTVRSTEVHKIHDPNARFSLAVYIHPYPASILVVWVYVAAIVNKRADL